MAADLRNRVQVERPRGDRCIEEVAEELLGKKVRVKVQAITAPPPSLSKPDTKARAVKTSKPGEQDPAMRDVLRAFPGAELIESDNPEA